MFKKHNKSQVKATERHSEEATAEHKPKQNRGIVLFLKASVSSQIASWVDVGVSQFLYIIGLGPGGAKAIGATCGGIINCCINYRWTFNSRECSKRHVAIKYLLVWLGSLGLNTGGTTLLNSIFDNVAWLDEYRDYCFLIAQLVTSLIVSICWNFQMQRHFVYRNVHIKQLFHRN